MINFRPVFEKETKMASWHIGYNPGGDPDPEYAKWLEARLAESTETLITEYRNICNNCGHSKCPTAGNPEGKCGEMMKTVIEHNTGESIEKALEARK